MASASAASGIHSSLAPTVSGQRVSNDTEDDVDESDDKPQGSEAEDEEIVMEDAPNPHEHRSGGGEGDDDKIDNDDSQVQEEDDSKLQKALNGVAPIKLGGPDGSNGVPAYALLVGLSLLTDGDTISTPTRSDDIISIPITRLPVTLGKEHTTRDPSFIGLKEHDDSPLLSDHNNISAPKLSQSMCSIYFRDARGGKVGLYKRGRKKETTGSNSSNNKNGSNDTDGNPFAEDPFDGMIYKPYQQNDDEEAVTPSSIASPDDILRLPGMDANASLPTFGFFAIECTGRTITVDKRVLKKGQCAMLQNGTTIQFASYYFYFLLPKSDKDPLTMKVVGLKTIPPISPATTASAATTLAIKIEKVKSKSAVIAGKNKKREHSHQNDDDSAIMSPTPKKTRIDPAAGEEEEDDDESNLNQPSSPHSTLFNDDQSDIELLRMLSERVLDASAWDHESQKLGSTLAIRACRAAAKSKTIQRIAREKGGVTQRDIVDWMNDRDGDSVFVEFETMMLTNITKKSLMMSIGKAIVRAGYKRNELISGRAFRWKLPTDIVPADASPSLVDRHMSMEEEDGESALDDDREEMEANEEDEG